MKPTSRKANAETIRHHLQKNRDSLESVALSLQSDLLDAYSQIAKITTVAIHAEEDASSAQKDLVDCQRQLARAEETVRLLEATNAAAGEELEQAWDYARRCKEVLLCGTYTIEMLEGELRETEGELQLMKIREKEGALPSKHVYESCLDAAAKSGKGESGMGGGHVYAEGTPEKQMEQRMVRLEEENRYLQDQLELYKRDARGKFSARHHLAKVA